MSEDAPLFTIAADGERLSERLQRLGTTLRTAGVRVGVGELIAAHRALAAIDPVDREDARAALRCVLCSGKADLEPFDAAFASIFGASDGGAGAGGASEPHADPQPPSPTFALPDFALPSSPRDQAPPPLQRPVPAAWSEVELLRDKDFADFTPAESALAQELIARLARRGPTRHSRRTRPSRHNGHAPDTRAVLRDSLRFGGEPLRLTRRAPTRRPRPVVLVCDVSGSMTPYARMLLIYLHACVAARRRVEAFALGTRLTRITGELAGRDHDRALARATVAVEDLGSGTRIGASLATLNREHGRRLGRGAVVIILSDGWDRGDPAELGAELGRLRRSAHRLVWLNPLAANPDWEPLTRGMQAAIPHVDRLMAGSTVRGLEQLADVLEEL